MQIIPPTNSSKTLAISAITKITLTNLVSPYIIAEFVIRKVILLLFVVILFGSLIHDKIFTSPLTTLGH